MTLLTEQAVNPQALRIGQAFPPSPVPPQMSGSNFEHGADADCNAASPAAGSLGVSETTDSSQPRIATGNARTAKAYMNNSSASATSNGNLQGSNDLTTEGNADTSAVAGAAGTDITASTDYGSRKSPDGADNGLQGGLHRPDFLSKGEHIPDGMGRAPRTGAELASNDAQRQAAGALYGSFDAQDVNAVQKKLEQQHS